MDIVGKMVDKKHHVCPVKNILGEKHMKHERKESAAYEATEHL